MRSRGDSGSLSYRNPPKVCSVCRADESKKIRRGMSLSLEFTIGLANCSDCELHLPDPSRVTRPLQSYWTDRD